MSRSIIKMLAFGFIGMFALISFNCASPDMTSARLYMQEEDWENALASLEKEIEKNPENAEAWFLKGAIQEELGQTGKMIESFNRSLAISDEYQELIETIKLNSWISYVNDGIEAYNMGDEDPQNYRDAIENFKMATRLEPDSTIAFKYWGFSEIILGNLEDATKPLKQVLELERDFDAAKYTGQIYFDMGYEIWREWLQEEMDAETRTKFEGYMESAIEYLTLAVEINPEDADVVATLSNTFITLGREDEAKEIFRRGIETEPDNKIYHYNLGVLVMDEGLFEEAIEHFRDALALDPEYADAYYNLGVTYVNWGVKLREDAVARGDEEDRSYRAKFEQALPYLERVIEYQPDSASLWETLGRLYANLDMINEAESAFERADRLGAFED